MSTPSIILGTAGHIDHGKTALVKVMTGIDTDRLKEEQQRGITIELGFAHLQVGETRFGVIDVPGHERFIKSMVAGASGIDLVMLVIAADEGVMPQTREHLDICQLLGVKQGFVALTKSDLVEEEWLYLVKEDIQRFLKGSFLEQAPIIPCSAVTGQGLEKLQQTLLELANQLRPRDPHGLLRLPLDRVFSMKGFGTVVTGTLLSGTLRTGQDVDILPVGIRGKVRGIQVHGNPVDQAVAGQRTAVNLGGIDRQEVSRGEVLVGSGTLAPSAMIEATIQLLPTIRAELPSRSKVLFHLGTRQQEATCVLLNTSLLKPGQTGLAQLRFNQPVLALPHDRFILRGFQKQENYGTTVGGGEVVHVLSHKIRPRDRQAMERIERMILANPEERLALEILEAGPLGLTQGALQQRLPFVADMLDKLLHKLRDRAMLVRFDQDRGAVVHVDHFRALSERILDLVKQFHVEHPLEPGMNREELRSRLGLGPEPRLFFILLQTLEKEGKLVVARASCHVVEHTVKQAGLSIQPLAERLREVYSQAGLGPPRDVTLVDELKLDAAKVAAALKLLLEEGFLVRLTDLYFPRPALEELHQRLVVFLEQEGQITPTQFKEMVGQSRKFCIPLAEYFDAQKLTIRVGEVRKLRR